MLRSLRLRARALTLVLTLLVLGCTGLIPSHSHIDGCDHNRCRGRINLPVATLGGRQFWSDVSWDQDWRIQRHVWTGHCRLLDPSGIRRAWGSRDECERRLACVRSGFEESGPEHLVVLLHGLGRTRWSLTGLADDLEMAGMATACLSYPSTRGSIEEHADGIEQLLLGLRGVSRVSFVTHSLGGLVVRELLDREQLWEGGLELQRLVMIAPPNQGAQLASLLQGTLLFNWIFDWIGGPAGGQIGTGAPSKRAIPKVPTLVVAGTGPGASGYNPLIGGDDDGIVGVQETQLAGAERLLVRGFHTTLMNQEEVRSGVLEFLKPVR